MNCFQRTVSSNIESICMFLKRLAYPFRLTDTVLIFERDLTEIYIVSNFTLDFMYSQHGHSMSTWNQNFLSPAQLSTYPNAVYHKGAVLPNFFVFFLIAQSHQFQGLSQISEFSEQYTECYEIFPIPFREHSYSSIYLYICICILYMPLLSLDIEMVQIEMTQKKNRKYITIRCKKQKRLSSTHPQAQHGAFKVSLTHYCPCCSFLYYLNNINIFSGI